MDKKTEKTPMNMRALKNGSYSLILCAAALALVIVLNLLVGSLPSSLTKPDFSTLSLYEIGEETKQIAAGVEVPVTMYLVAPAGQENLLLLELMHRYADLSPKITVKTVDPDTNPSFVPKYTTEALSSSSVIVESEYRHYVVDYNSIYVTSYENMTEEDYYNYLYYGIMPQGTPYFYGEMMLTTALDYVSSPVIPTVYVLSGHDETELTDTISATLKTNNIATNSLSLLTVDAIPGDCSAILVNNPKMDLNAAESEMLTAYVKNGGNIILITDYRYYSTEKMPNLTALAATMGMRSEDGLLIEHNRSNYYQYPVYLLPVIGTTGPAAMLPTTNMYTLITQAHGIVLTGEGEASASSFLTTTTSSFVKPVITEKSTFEKEEGDVDGPFSVAAHATLGEGKFVWYSSTAITDANTDQAVSGGNSTLFMSSVNWMCEKEVAVSIVAKTLQVAPLIVPAGAANMWSTVLVIVLPLAILGGGFAVWFRRRRR